MRQASVFEYSYEMGGFPSAARRSRALQKYGASNKNSQVCSHTAYTSTYPTEGTCPQNNPCHTKFLLPRIRQYALRIEIIQLYEHMNDCAQTHWSHEMLPKFEQDMLLVNGVTY